MALNERPEKKNLVGVHPNLQKGGATCGGAGRNYADDGR